MFKEEKIRDSRDKGDPIMTTITVWLLVSIGSTVTTIAQLADREECTRLRNDVTSRQSELRCVQATIVAPGGSPARK